MRLGILGPFEVADDQGREIALGGPKQRSVLAILLLHADELSERLLDPGRQRLIDSLARVDDLRWRYGLHSGSPVFVPGRQPGGWTSSALHAANGSGRGREDRHFKFYAEGDNLRSQPGPI